MVICHIAVYTFVSCVLYLAAIMTQDVNQYVFHCTTFIWDVCLQTLFLYEVLSSMKVLRSCSATKHPPWRISEEAAIGI